jgi:hypothetical protein
MATATITTIIIRTEGMLHTPHKKSIGTPEGTVTITMEGREGIIITARTPEAISAPPPKGG